MDNLVNGQYGEMCVCVAWCLIPASQVSHRLGLRYSILDPGAGVELAVETQMLLEHIENNIN